MTPAPQLSLHPDDAAAFLLQAGETARIETVLGPLRLAVRLEPNQVRGVAIVPRIRDSVTAHLIPGSGAQPCRIIREEEA